VKSLLNLIEHPRTDYEKVAIYIASSEGVTAERIGRHDWANLYTMWNMSREGFQELYDLLPDPKPPFEEVWRTTGGNPRALEMLFDFGWRVDRAVNAILVRRRLPDLLDELSDDEKEILRKAVDDPDTLRGGGAAKVRRLLIEKNLVIAIPMLREHYLWIDVPPPERDPELGVGRFYAWQTPLHREAVRKALGG